MNTTESRKNAIVRSLTDNQVFDAFRELDHRLERDRKNIEVWQVRVWMFEELERRNMVIDDEDHCYIVVGSHRYDAFTLLPVSSQCPTTHERNDHD